MSSVTALNYLSWPWALLFHSWPALLVRLQSGCKTGGWSGYSAYAQNHAAFGAGILCLARLTCFLLPANGWDSAFVLMAPRLQKRYCMDNSHTLDRRADRTPGQVK